jgi:3-hydroxyisobutyrate dehydrogenase-like beta-hydroxyacid dehydrogenase
MTLVFTSRFPPYNTRTTILIVHPLIWLSGLGSMGLAMALNLQRHLSSIAAPPLAYNNRTMSRGEPLAGIGGVGYEDVGELVANADVIFLSVCQAAPATSPAC